MIGVILTAGAALVIGAPSDAQPSASYPSIFGIQMMTSMSIPECQFSSIALKHPEAFKGNSIVEPYDYGTKEICYKRIGSRAGSAEPLVNELLNVEYPFDKQPQLATYVSAQVVDGRVQGVTFSTHGVRTQELVLSSLEQRFGKPTNLITTTEQNGFGAKFEVIRASWAMPNDITVTFQGAASRFDAGLVSILTSAARAQQEQKNRQLLGAGTPM